MMHSTTSPQQAGCSISILGDVRTALSVARTLPAMTANVSIPSSRARLWQQHRKARTRGKGQRSCSVLPAYCCCYYCYSAASVAACCFTVIRGARVCVLFLSSAIASIPGMLVLMYSGGLPTVPVCATPIYRNHWK